MLQVRPPVQLTVVPFRQHTWSSPPQLATTAPHLPPAGQVLLAVQARPSMQQFSPVSPQAVHLLASQRKAPGQPSPPMPPVGQQAAPSVPQASHLPPVQRALAPHWLFAQQS
jgi:hypothetical protein